PGRRRPPALRPAARATRMLVRVPRRAGLALAAALRRGGGVLSARQPHEPARVKIAPLHIG
ncbi:hypothetical protein, partial [Mycobacterium avium]|uniref:hypothetical protein n=1 Tax=Mycobacterium avium TaxID=1764 RepID=UPI000A63647D